MNNKILSTSARALSMKKWTLLCGLSLGAFSGVTLAQQAQGAIESKAPLAAGAKEIKLLMGSQHELSLPSGVERIAIGDDTIAGVHIKRAGKGAGAKILLSPLKPGSTSFMVWPRGEAQAQTYVLNVQQRVELRTAKASSLIEQQFANELANAQTGDKVKTVDLSSVQLKSNVVQVDVKVVEFNKTLMKNVGINLFSTAVNSHGFSFGILSKGAYRSGGPVDSGFGTSPMSAAFNLLMQFDRRVLG